MNRDFNTEQAMQAAAFVFTIPGGIQLSLTLGARDLLRENGVEFLSLDQLGFLLLLAATALAFLVGGWAD